jgi:arabinofuranan 3-O-arabinosyltransferase
MVDQESTDLSIKIANNFNAKTLHLPAPLFYSPPTKSRNLGAASSNGEILYHLDSDMELSPGLIEESVEIFSSNKNIGALIVHEVDATSGFWSKVKAFERKCYWGNDSIESARIVRKEIFNKICGYDENLNSGEDFDIHKRYKEHTKIAYCNNTVSHNLGHLNFIKLITKKYQYGKTAKLYFSKSGTSGLGLVKEQFLCYAKNYREFLKHPILGCSTIFLKVAEFSSGLAGMSKGSKGNDIRLSR